MEKIQIGWNKTKQQGIGFGKTQVPSTSKNKKEPFYIEGQEGHLMTIAPTGKGKGRNAIIPTLLTYDGPVVVIDPKGEAAAITAKRRKKFGEVVVLDPFQLTTKTPDAFNPIDICDFRDESVSTIALKLTHLLKTGHKHSAKEPFWDNKSGSLISGILAYIVHNEQPENRHFGTLRSILGKEDVVYKLATILDANENLDSYAYEEISQFIQTTDVTRSGILSTAQQHIQILGDPKVLNSMSKTTFDLKAYQEGKIYSIYIVLPPDKLQSHASLLRLWVASLMDLLMDRKFRPEVPNLFIIDEAAQLGDLDSFRTAMTLLRGYGVRVWSFWQDLSQLKGNYEKDWQTLTNNVEAFQTFGVTSFIMAKELSALLGRISPSQLLALKAEEQVIVTSGAKLTICEKIDYLMDKQYQGKYEPNPMFKNWGKKKVDKEPKKL